MAELCKKCFIKTWHPNAYDKAHIVMSEDNEFCEGCMDCVPYVDHIDPSDLLYTSTLADFIRVVVPEMKRGHRLACVECGLTYNKDDLAFVHETGECPYCHKPTNNLWVMKKRFIDPMELKKSLVVNSIFEEHMTLEDIIDEIEDADVEIVTHGKWIPFLDGDDIMPERYYRCSECRRVEAQKEPYCHCGAKMDRR